MGRQRKNFVQTGQRFGKGVVTSPEIRVRQGSKSTTADGKRWGARLRCDCGTVYEADLASLLDGKRRSCGCLRGPWTPHGLASHPLYRTWRQMLARCENPRDPAYRNYGGRGITVCPEWHDPAVFIAWIEANLGPRPDGMTLDRYPGNDGPYAPGKVRWATAQQQRANQTRAQARIEPREGS